MKPTKEKSVMLSLLVDDVDEWYRYLLVKGLKLDPPTEPMYNPMRVLIFKDPEGYMLEFLQWLTPNGKMPNRFSQVKITRSPNSDHE